MCEVDLTRLLRPLSCRKRMCHCLALAGILPPLLLVRFRLELARTWPLLQLHAVASQLPGTRTKLESGKWFIETAYNQRVVLWSIPALMVLRT